VRTLAPWLLVASIGCSQDPDAPAVDLSTGEDSAPEDLATAPPDLSPSCANPACAGAIPLDCAAPGTPQFHIIYARPQAAPDRYALFAPKLQRAVLTMSWYLNSEAKAATRDNRYRARLRVECQPDGMPVIHDAPLPGVAQNTGDAFVLVDALKKLGNSVLNEDVTGDKYLVFFDGTGGVGVGLSASCDDNPDPDSCHNRGGYAFQWSWVSDAPHWDVFMHEGAHIMGAVGANAPHTSGAGHCNDGHDTMCYDDGGPKASYMKVCNDRHHFDCNYDDYFNPSPPAGSYLATHWNLAAPYNKFLTGGKELTAPAPYAAPQALLKVGFTLMWKPSPEPAIVGYMVYRDLEKGNDPNDPSFFPLEYTTSTSYSDVDPPAKSRYYVVAYDALGNLSPPSNIVQ
jgi:hypothetical protein